MKKILCLLFLLMAFTSFAAESRTATTTNVMSWMTNTFRSWLTRSYPDINNSFYPDWVKEHPPGLQPGPFTNWLAEVFPDLESEMFPTWLENPDLEHLGTNVPTWWEVAMKGKYSVSPAARPIATIIRGPYLQLSTTNSVVVRWRTDIPTSHSVYYGSSLRRMSSNARSPGSSTEHAVQVDGLKPGSKYFYSIGHTDTPLLVRLTNNIAFLTSTNSKIYVNKPGTREQIAVGNRDTFVLSLAKENSSHATFSVSDLEQSFKSDTTNSTLVVNTPNNAVLLSVSNGTLLVTTSNHVTWVNGTDAEGRPEKQFVVGTTNLIRTGGDSNTFFVTHPPVGAKQPVRVWVLGDPGTRKKAQRDVRDAYYKWNGERDTDLVLTLGDNAYTTGKDSEYQGSIFDAYATILRKTVLWPNLGNHDAGSATSPIQFGVFYDVFTLPAQGQAGGVMSGTEAYYSFDYANIHFVCIDSSDSNWSTNGSMVQWLKTDLEANKQDWLVAYCHHPPHTKGSHNSDQDRDSEARMRKLRENVLPILEENGLDLMLTGHSHSYERSYLMDGFYGRSTNLNASLHFKSKTDGRKDGTGVYRKPTRGPAPHEGAVYVVAGSSGQTSGGKLDHPVNFLSLNVLGSMVLDFNGNRLDATFLDDKAKVRDSFTIIKGADAEEKVATAE